MAKSSSADLQSIDCAAEIIRGTKRAVALTGAGISTPSGIPDFRSVHGGLWERYDPFEVASLSAFRYHPEKFFNWIRPLADDMRQAKPNPAHIALASLERAGLLKTIITQNIDGLHQRAGSKNVIEVHGSMEKLTCVGCYRKYSTAEFEVSFFEEGVIPLCPACSHILKPDVVLYGEQLPVRAWLAAKRASSSCDLMLVVGSSLEVLPVAGLPMRALENGAHLIVVNKSPTYIDVRADLVFSEDIAEIMPRIAAEVLEKI
ncbi:MAG: NAD-dependent deacylase [Anaerolineales bacterium]|jgi:NAD-dependent deacetylase